MDRKRLSDDFKGRHCIQGGEAFFDGLLGIVGGRAVGEAEADSITAHVRGFIDAGVLAGGDYGEGTYLRSYIGRDASGWEAILMSWRAGDRTAIHSHPDYAGYNFMDGEFLVEVFEPVDENRARKTGEIKVTGRQSFHSLGHPGAFDNHIHRITCLSDTGHSLHVYSDDALKGYKYEEVL